MTTTNTPALTCTTKNCSAMFQSSQLYYNHMRLTHQMEAVPCPIQACHKKYKTRNGLTTHVDTKHLAAAMTCLLPGCGETLRTRDDVFRHLREQHRIPIPNDNDALLGVANCSETCKYLVTIWCRVNKKEVPDLSFFDGEQDDGDRDRTDSAQQNSGKAESTSTSVKTSAASTTTAVKEVDESLPPLGGGYTMPREPPYELTSPADVKKNALEIVNRYWLRRH